MSRKENKYALVKENCLVYELTNLHKSEQRTAFLGSVVRIDNVLGGGKVAIRFLESGCMHFESALYYCNQAQLVVIEENIWPYLLAVPSPAERVRLGCSIEFCEFLNGITEGSVVEVLWQQAIVRAVVRYKGVVEAMGVGFYYGLEIIKGTTGTDCDGSYGRRNYFSCTPGKGLFVSVDKIYHPTNLGFTTIHQTVQEPQCISKAVNVATSEAVKRKLPQSSSLHTIPTIKDSDTTVIKPDSTYPNTASKTAESDLPNSEIDLIELLGSWSLDQPKQTVTSSTRNKSLNPLSHIINSRKSVKTKETVVNTTNTKSQKQAEEVKEHWTCDSPETNELGIGSLVEVDTDVSDPLYGVIRWGPDRDGLVGIELEEEHEHLPLTLTDGTHNGQRHFSCSHGRALFVPIERCHKDQRFQDGHQVANVSTSKMFGQLDSPVISGAVPPLSMPTQEDVLAVCGKYRGIQGHHNSCYLDATLFAMFTYTAVFDSLLFRPRTSSDLPLYDEVQRVLREEIVNPLRQNLYVRADRIMKLRTLLDQLSSVSGLTSEEKDPEEFLNSLLAHVLRAEPFLKLSSGQDAFYYQLFVEKDEGLALPSVQQLFEQSFLSSDIKLKEVPSCLIVQMPRFGKNFKMYPRILPSQLLDVTDIIENSPRQCTVCGKLARFECRECFGQCGVGLESTAFCAPCLETAHAHAKRSSHKPRPLPIPHDFEIIAEHCPPPRLFMELFAVVCIETSHYVAFVKCGSGHEAPWCFFDSMADRKGEQNGYNIPEMVACPDVSCWLQEDGAASRLLHEAAPHDRQLPEHARRLLCDAYICMYQSPDVMMYR